MSTIEYVKNFIKDPNIASITPTSQKGVREVCRKMDLNKKVVIVEYGPATGVFTNYLLKRITPDSMIIAIELNENFVGYLKENVKDPRLKVHHDSAENIIDIVRGYGLEKVDYVISGIPFSLLDEDTREDIVKRTSHMIKKGGKFLLYQTFFQKDEHLKVHLEDYFSKANDQYFFRNVPPLRLYEAIKQR
ncbi:class I SAM-dependent methyltransferase [Planomicrobium sp. CPCC 101079]|uniref:class I SAM-dependent methyltransferase n=1 Tax=Planomicrobium sp. CPCC 101079 TaxID=2599618 RepID=UPI0011B460D4|nr:methyltransferase domain-containing protein [Planomicrobium sp. CPCC 101079]TWT00502.1 methyltransferase domain-containing protein [Planomicrobium sp. CPCC 101079]